MVRKRVDDEEEDELDQWAERADENHPTGLAFTFGEMMAAPEEGDVLNDQSQERHGAECRASENWFAFPPFHLRGDEYCRVHEQHTEPDAYANDCFGSMLSFHSG